MKKVFPAIAGITACFVLFGTAACKGKHGEKLTWEKAAPAYESADATLKLTGTLDRASQRISGDLFGLFLEDINYASYALDANSVANGSFEYDVNGKEGWTEDGATITVATEKKVYETNAHYAQINVSRANGTVANTGFKYVPMAVTANTDYVFSAFFGDYEGDVTVRVKGSDGTSYGETTFAVSVGENDWVQYRRTLTATGYRTERLRLEISFGTADSSVRLDAVSFKTTESTAGIKNYIYEALADLSPAFFRFPGGCIIEGKDNDSYYDWKNSIGAVKSGGDDKVEAFTYKLDTDGTPKDVTTYGEASVRTPNTDIWQNGTNYYEMEYGLGFYEYFVLCDTLGAKAVPVVNCGKACQTQGDGRALAGRHGNKINDFIQDAIDLIHFAKGDVNAADEDESYWANVRKNMGHAEPFAMDYIGIGNEQWGDYYTKYYEKFLENKAFMDTLEKFDVKPIVGNCTMFQHCEDPDLNRKGEAQKAAMNYVDEAKANPDRLIGSVAEYGVVDQHYYVNYTDLFANAHLYDNYTRPTDGGNSDKTYYEVFVGEYAANSEAVRSPSANDNEKYTEYYRENSTGRNTWMTALSEGAMMTGFERNGDIVRMAAYAPMFGNQAGNNQWWVDMMFYTNTELVLTPNYYIQQLFMKNSGDFVLESEIEFASGAMPTTVHKSNGTATREVDNVFYVTSLDEETGDIIVKIVNAGKDDLKTNVNVAVSGLTLKGVGAVTTLTNEDPKAISTLKNGCAVEPETVTIGEFTDNTLGCFVPAYGAVAIRIATK